jgi:hypothetical protein
MARGSCGDALLIELAEVRAACRAVAGWYDDLFAGRPATVRELEDALRRVRALPHVGGRLGRALRDLADPPDDLTEQGLDEHLARLWSVAGGVPGQLQLPGL